MLPDQSVSYAMLLLSCWNGRRLQKLPPLSPGHISKHRQPTRSEPSRHWTTYRGRYRRKVESCISCFASWTNHSTCSAVQPSRCVNGQIACESSNSSMFCRFQIPICFSRASVPQLLIIGRHCNACFHPLTCRPVANGNSHRVAIYFRQTCVDKFVL
jgi:hypothetical protein